MADELTITRGIVLSAANKPNVNYASSSGTYDMSGDQVCGFSQSIPTTAAGTLLDMTAIGTEGFGRFDNIDATNFVEIGVQVGGTFYPLARVNPGDPPAEFRCSQGVSFYARADTAAVILDWRVFED